MIQRDSFTVRKKLGEYVDLGLLSTQKCGRELFYLRNYDFCKLLAIYEYLTDCRVELAEAISALKDEASYLSDAIEAAALLQK